MKFLLCLLLSLPVFSQSFLPTLFPQLTSYLQLTDAQGRTISSNNVEYSRLNSEKQARIVQVQIEIAGESTKETIDPNALGIRYMEIELICRDLKELSESLRKRNIDVLNAVQQARLKSLEEAMRLMPVISQAQSANLLPSPAIPGSFGSLTSGALLGLPAPFPAACGTAPHRWLPVPIFTPLQP